MKDFGEPTTLELTRAETLVLFDWLHEAERDDRTLSDDPAVERALWNLAAVLEKTLVEPFEADYASTREKARAYLLAE